jgi:hypothetical protein
VNYGAYNITQEVYGAFQFQSESVLKQLKSKCEETIFTELRSKINEFLSIVEGLQWRPKKPDPKPHDFVEDMVNYLRSTIGCLLENRELAKLCYLTAFQHIAGRLTQVLAESKSITHINQCGFLNLYLLQTHL